MSVEQIESAIRALPPKEREQFIEWFDGHRHEIAGDAGDDLSEAQKAELFQRRREYDEHPERFTRMDKESLDRLFSRVRENVAARFSSPR